MLIFPLEKCNCFTVIKKNNFCARSVFHSERVLESFYMVISEIKTTFYTKCIKNKCVQLTIRNILVIKNNHLQLLCREIHERSDLIHFC